MRFASRICTLEKKFIQIKKKKLGYTCSLSILNKVVSNLLRNPGLVIKSNLSENPVYGWADNRLVGIIEFPFIREGFNLVSYPEHYT
jgi:hypothetical protein